jgi:hypothetical protein
MKKFTLQLQDIYGNVEKENDVIISDNDTLIMQFPESMTLDQAHHCFKLLNKSIESGGIAGLPNTITFKIIKSN